MFLLYVPAHPTILKFDKIHKGAKILFKICTTVFNSINTESFSETHYLKSRSQKVLSINGIRTAVPKYIEVIFSVLNQQSV